MAIPKLARAVTRELRRQTTGPLRLRRQVFSPRRELRRIERRHRQVLLDPSLQLGVWESHQPVLIELLRQLPEPRVLELGIGYASTPIVLGLSARSVSLETDEDWLRRFGRFDREDHRILHWSDYSESEWRCPYLDEPWDLAFVDNSPHSTRQSNLVKLAETARFVVCHDTEECFKPAASSYGWDFSGFTHVWTLTRFANYTTVASNFDPVPLTHLGGVTGQPAGAGRTAS